MMTGEVHGRRGFTLLEAVLAVSLLAAVMIVCVGIRAQALAGARRFDERHAVHRDTTAVFEMLSAGLLGRPEVDPETFTRTWKGTYLGEAFTLTARRVIVPNPVFEPNRVHPEPMSDRIVMWRYDLQFRGRASTFWWHR